MLLRVAVFAVATGSLALFAQLLAPFQQLVLAFAGVNVMMAVALNLVLGTAGQVTLASAVIYGVGAYGTAISADRWGLPFPIALAIGTALATLIGIASGLPAIRVRGLYLALVTLAMLEALQVVIQNWTDLTGGPQGMAVPPPTSSQSGYLDLEIAVLLPLAGAVLVVIIARAITKSPIGSALVAINDDERVADSLGVPVATHKLWIFAVTSAMFGLAGGLFAYAVQFIDPSAFGLDADLAEVTWIIVGGIGSIPGAILGAVLFTWLPEFLRPLAEYNNLILVGLLLAFLLLAPRGLIGIGASALKRMFGATSMSNLLSGGTPITLTLAAVVTRRQVPASNNSSDTQTLLALNEVVVTFGGLVALDRVNLRVNQRTVHGLIGPNGAGKSTLVDVISGIRRPRSGHLEFLGRDITKLPPHARANLGIARTYQHVRLFAHLNVLNNVLLGAYVFRPNLGLLLLGVRSAERAFAAQQAKAHEVLDAFGLSHIANAPMDQLSLAQMRLIEVARALLMRPSLLVMDEPASGADPEQLHLLGALIKQTTAVGMTVLLIEHNLEFVMSVSDVITVLDRGQVIAHGTPNEIGKNAQVVGAYLGQRGSEYALDQGS